MSSVLQRMRVHWQVVQVRQAQRLAREALLGFVEDELSAFRAHDSETLAQRLVNAVPPADLPAARLAAPLPATVARDARKVWRSLRPPMRSRPQPGRH